VTTIVERGRFSGTCPNIEAQPEIHL